MELLRRFTAEQESEEAIIEKLDEWKDCVNRLASTSDGQHFLKHMIKFSGLLGPKKHRDAARLLEDNGKAAFYVEYVRPYLDSTLRQGIE